MLTLFVSHIVLRGRIVLEKHFSFPFALRLFLEEIKRKSTSIYHRIKSSLLHKEIQVAKSVANPSVAFETAITPLWSDMMRDYDSVICNSLSFVPLTELGDLYHNETFLRRLLSFAAPSSTLPSVFMAECDGI